MHYAALRNPKMIFSDRIARDTHLSRISIYMKIAIRAYVYISKFQTSDSHHRRIIGSLNSIRHTYERNICMYVTYVFDVLILPKDRTRFLRDIYSVATFDKLRIRGYRRQSQEFSNSDPVYANVRLYRDSSKRQKRDRPRRLSPLLISIPMWKGISRLSFVSSPFSFQ